MNYLMKNILLITICTIKIIFSQSIYNQQLYDLNLNNQVIKNTESQKNWVNQENIGNVETILEETIDPDKYIVGPGDQFAINIISSDGVFNYILEVTPTGDLLLPLIGLINIDQLSLKAAIEQIKNLGISKYENSKLEITLIKLRSFKVYVAGAIKESGFVVVSAIDRLSNVIKKAGGFVPLSKEFNIVIIHQDGTIDNINYLEFLRTGDMSQNPIINNGDQINIPYGYIGNEWILSGDDDLLLQKVALQSNYLIEYSMASNTAINSNAPKNFKDFLSQRLRFASKGIFYYQTSATIELKFIIVIL